MENRVQVEEREGGAWSLGSAGEVVYVAPEPGPKEARVWFFTRKGGVSERPFDSLNISLKVGDEPEAVTAYATPWTGASRPGYAKSPVIGSCG